MIGLCVGSHDYVCFPHAGCRFCASRVVFASAVRTQTLRAEKKVSTATACRPILRRRPPRARGPILRRPVGNVPFCCAIGLCLLWEATGLGRQVLGVRWRPAPEGTLAWSTKGAGIQARRPNRLAQLFCRALPRRAPSRPTSSSYCRGGSNRSKAAARKLFGELSRSRVSSGLRAPRKQFARPLETWARPSGLIGSKLLPCLPKQSCRTHINSNTADTPLLGPSLSLSLSLRLPSPRRIEPRKWPAHSRISIYTPV